MQYNVGDKVKKVASGTFTNIPTGITGIIVSISDRNIGVAFDKSFVGGHNLDGRCKEGHGHWINTTDISLCSWKEVIENDRR